MFDTQTASPVYSQPPPLSGVSVDPSAISKLCDCKSFLLSRRQFSICKMGSLPALMCCDFMSISA